MFVKIALEEDGKTAKLSEDGKPIFLDDKDNEVPVDVPSMYQKIIDLGKENKTHREAATTLKESFAIFDDIEDIAAWKAEADKALETVANFNEKDWLKAEKVESMKRQMKEAHEADVENVRNSFEGTVREKDTIINRKDAQIRNLTISANFGMSPLFVGEGKKTTMTPDAAEAIFGRHFEVQEHPDKPEKLIVRAYYSPGGEMIYSTANPGEPADFNEGMAAIWELYPHKNNYIKGDKGGSGGTGGTGGGEKEDTSDIATLQKQYDEAVAAKNTTLAISLKNRIWDLKQKARKVAA